MNKVKRISILVCLLALAVCATILPVSADKPVIGGCPPGWVLIPLSELNLGDLTGAPSVDGNGDGLTCAKPLDIPPYPDALVLVDNSVMKP